MGGSGNVSKFAPDIAIAILLQCANSTWITLNFFVYIYMHMFCPLPLVPPAQPQQLVNNLSFPFTIIKAMINYPNQMDCIKVAFLLALTTHSWQQPRILTCYLWNGTNTLCWIKLSWHALNMIVVLSSTINIIWGVPCHHYNDWLIDW
jgi:hypothetical protein